MADADETTAPGVLRAELRHLDDRIDEVQARHEERLDRHGSRIHALELFAERLRGAWWAVGLAAAVFAFFGSFLAQWWFAKGG